MSLDPRVPDTRPIPFRRMLDGTPCWCISTPAPYEGWVHSPVCIKQRRAFPPDPIRPLATDHDLVEQDRRPNGAGCALAVAIGFVFWAGIAIAFIAGIIVGQASAPSSSSQATPTILGESMSGPPASSSEAPTPVPLIASASVLGVVSPSPAPTRRPTARPTLRPAGASVRVEVTWYCNFTHPEARRSRCARGHPDVAGDQLYAAVSPDLPWRGKIVEVCARGACVPVLIIDCDCQATRSLDLYADAFLALAPLGAGRISAIATVQR